MASIYPIESNKVKHIHRKFKRLEKKRKRKFTKRKYSKTNWKEVAFPERVKLIEEPNETLKHFNQAYKYYRKGHNVSYNLSKTVQFSPESIAVLSACISGESFTNGMGSKGSLPRNYILKKMFMASGFFDHVNLITSVPKKDYTSHAKLLHKVTNNKVETEIAKEACRYVMPKIKARYVDDLEPLYVILVEAMQNTNNHASAKRDIFYDWWLYRYEDKTNEIIHFTFLDIGVGVFNSLPVMNWKRKFTNSANFTSNLSLVDDLLEGKIKSRTLRKDRGKGIPQIHDQSKDQMFNDFYILSNNILIDTKNNIKTKLEEEFLGTLYYWTIKIKK